MISQTTLPSVVFDGVIDVSHHNGVIDWPAVAADGITLAFIKATQGVSFVDPKFDRNRKDAVNAKISVVPYHFIDTSSSDFQGSCFLNTVGVESPTMLDWETEAPLSSIVKIGQYISFWTKRDPVGYYGYAQLKQTDPDLSRWPLMLPAYPGGVKPGGYSDLVKQPPRLPPGRPIIRPYDFHQYTPAGRVAGITTPVDRSIWVGTKEELQHWCKTGARPNPVIPEEPKNAIEMQKEVQRVLTTSGDYDGPIDGDPGPQTRMAMKVYRVRNGL